MTRRRPTPFVALTAALALLAVHADRTFASGMAAFRLMNIDPAGSEPISSVLARIQPPSTVVARDVENDPPTILPESSGYDSSGFDQEALEAGLIEGSGSDGNPFQILKLDFGPGGLAPGGKLYFQLKKAPDYTGDVSLVLPDSVTNLALETLDHLNPTGPTDPGDSGSTPPPSEPGGVQVPEPTTALVWASLAGLLGLARARAQRRSPARTAA